MTYIPYRNEVLRALLARHGKAWRPQLLIDTRLSDYLLRETLTRMEKREGLVNCKRIKPSEPGGATMMVSLTEKGKVEARKLISIETSF